VSFYFAFHCSSLSLTTLRTHRALQDQEEGKNLRIEMESLQEENELYKELLSVTQVSFYLIF